MLKDFRFSFCRLIFRRTVPVCFASSLDLSSPTENRQSSFLHHTSDFKEISVFQGNSDLVPLFFFGVFGDSEEIANLWYLRLVLWPVKADGFGASVAAGLCWVPVPRWETTVRNRNQIFSPFGESSGCGSYLQGSVEIETSGELFVPLVLLAVLVRHFVFHSRNCRRQ